MASHTSFYRHGALVVAAYCVSTLIALVPLRIFASSIDVPISQPILTDNTLLWQVAPDECFNGIGVDYPAMNPDGTCSVGQPKANQSYIWGLTEQSGQLWFGTMANTYCTLSGVVDVTPKVTPNVVCEYAKSEFARTYPSIPANRGDWRVPAIYSWNLASGTLTQKTVTAPLLQTTLGLRGAGSIDNIAFLAGPSLLGSSANFFAFQADTGKFLGSCARTDYNYARDWQVVDGVLYVGLGSPTYGSVMRWNGTSSSFGPGKNFCDQFVEVGRVNADVANITLYTGADGLDRLAITTVPSRGGGGGDVAAATPSVAGVWISPPIPAGGLTPDQTNEWTQIWSPLQYDPDPIVSRYGYAGGAIEQYDGWLYWGTLHDQSSAAIQVEQRCTQSYCFGAPANGPEYHALEAGVYRTTSVWRGRNLEDPNTSEIQLLYGETQLPVCCSPAKTFNLKPTGWTPVYGPSGFGNPGNEYTWTMAVFDGHLFIGTYDASIRQGPAARPEDGADLWRFDDSNSPAVNENYSGLGDKNNYGIRILHTLDDNSGVIAGMANPFNLAPGSGWELRLLQEASPQPSGKND